MPEYAVTSPISHGYTNSYLTAALTAAMLQRSVQWVYRTLPVHHYAASGVAMYDTHLALQVAARQVLPNARIEQIRNQLATMHSEANTHD